MDTITTTASAARTAQDRDEFLDTLLDAELAYSPLARRGFISHLAMGMIAARRLGASDAELQRGFDDETAGDFVIARDRPDWLDRDIARIAEVGIDAEVRRRLPALITDPASQYFHAVIRLELAIDAGHVGQVANALQNWSDHGRPLADVPDGTGRSSYREVLDGLLDEPPASAAGWDIASDPAFVAAFRELRGHDGLLDEVAAVAIACHAASDNFASLHMVTGNRAIRAVAPLLDADDARELALRNAVATAAAVLSSESVLASDSAADELRASNPPEWSTIGRAAIGTGDPHVMKLAYACRLEESVTGDPLYRAVAARQSG